MNVNKKVKVRVRVGWCRAREHQEPNQPIILQLRVDHVRKYICSTDYQILFRVPTTSIRSVKLIIGREIPHDRTTCLY